MEPRGDDPRRSARRHQFNWPLWQGGGSMHASAENRRASMNCRRSMTSWCMDCVSRCSRCGRKSQSAAQTAATRAEINASFRDQALEKARAEYEMELKTNLGSSMAETQYRGCEARHRISSGPGLGASGSVDGRPRAMDKTLRQDPARGQKMTHKSPFLRGGAARTALLAAMLCGAAAPTRAAEYPALLDWSGRVTLTLPVSGVLESVAARAGQSVRRHECPAKYSSAPSVAR
jgi:hypothetical protein